MSCEFPVLNKSRLWEIMEKGTVPLCSLQMPLNTVFLEGLDLFWGATELQELDTDDRLFCRCAFILVWEEAFCSGSRSINHFSTKSPSLAGKLFRPPRDPEFVLPILEPHALLCSSQTNKSLKTLFRLVSSILYFSSIELVWRVSRAWLWSKQQDFLFLHAFITNLLQMWTRVQRVSLLQPLLL